MERKSLLEIFESKGLLSETVTYKRGEWIEKEGVISNTIYFIESGSLKVYLQNKDSEQIIRFGYKNDLVVALDSFLSDQKSDFNIQAIKLTKVRRIQKTAFFELIKSEEKYLKIWIGILENLVQQQIEREKDLLVESPLERYNRVLSRSPRLFQEIPHKYIANYLRMTPETLSRLKKS
jgi:CRP-like cAMP-binding protein